MPIAGSGAPFNIATLQSGTVSTSDLLAIADVSEGGIPKAVTVSSVLALASSGGTPGGANTNIQYNDSGVFGADANLTWNKTTQLHTISGQEIISYNNSNNSTSSSVDHLRFNNTGTYTHIGFSYSGTLKSRYTVNSDAGTIISTGGGNAHFSFRTGANLAASAERLYIHSGGIYTYYNGFFGEKLTAGSASADAGSTFSNYGSSAHKGRLVTEVTYTLDNETFIYADPSSATFCDGTPTTPCSSYGDESSCNSHSNVGCDWSAGSSCNDFNGDQSTCDSTTPCSYEVLNCLGPTDQSSCESQDDTYGGACVWSTANTCTIYVDETSCNSQSGCSWSSTPCSTWNGDQSVCQSFGCTYESLTCVGATSESACLALDDPYGGTCSWTPGGDCSGFGDQSSCEAQSPCVWAQITCSTYNNTSQATCEGFAGCTFLTSSCLGPTDSASCTNQNSPYGGGCFWSTGNTCSTFGDEFSCNSQSGCSWNGSSCDGTYEYCDGSYYNGACDGTGPYTCTGVYGSCSGDYYTGNCTGSGPTSCTGSYDFCDGTYYTGTCLGTYGAGCTGDADCSLLTTSGACSGEPGCSWQTVQILTLPDAITINKTQTSREYSIVHVGNSGTVSITPNTGDTIFQHSSDIKLYKTGDRVWLHQHHLYSNCSTLTTFEDCDAQASCDWNTPCAQYTSEVSCMAASGEGCTWVEGACVGAETCTGTYISSRPWFVHNLERGKNYVEKTADYTLTLLDDIVNVTANTVTLTVLSAVGIHRKEFTIKNSGAGIVTINTTSSQTIDGLASGVITLASMDAITIQSTASGNWVII